MGKQHARTCERTHARKHARTLAHKLTRRRTTHREGRGNVAGHSHERNIDLYIRMIQARKDVRVRRRRRRRRRRCGSRETTWISIASTRRGAVWRKPNKEGGSCYTWLHVGGMHFFCSWLRGQNRTGQPRQHGTGLACMSIAASARQRDGCCFAQHGSGCQGA